MTDNFDLIRGMMNFENEGEFYFIQCLQRKKENKELGNHSRLIKAYYIYSLEQLEKYKDEMIQLCNTFNARLYIHLNRRNAKRVALDAMKELAHFISCEQYFTISKIYNTACGRANSIDKTWIVDFDSKEDTTRHILIGTIDKLEPFGNKLRAIVPTKSGYHLITSVFNVAEFRKRYPDIEIHKNNPTVLYIP